jgi:hypothetical protein
MINDFQLEVWELRELAGDRLEWTLAHEANLKERDHKMNYVREEPSVQPRKQWAVVVSSKDLISLFDEEGEEVDDYSDEGSNDDCDDGTESVEDAEGEEERERERGRGRGRR